jgi:UDP-glucose 4-epimerase
MIFVTGGSGFIGTHILRHLVNAGQDVVSFSLEPPSPGVALCLADFSSQIRFVQGDIQDSDKLSEIFGSNEFSCIIHCAAVNGEPAARANPKRAVEVNVAGTASVLSAALSKKVRRVIYLGSGTQYGPCPDLKPVAETTPAHPAGIYATSKQMAEMYGHAFADLTGLEFVSVRISAPYGPFEVIEPSPMHVRYWCDAASAGRPIVLERGADHPRDFTFVEDTAAGVIAICLADDVRSPVVNISSGQLYTLQDLVKVMRQLRPNGRWEVGPGLLDDGDPRTASSLRGPLDIQIAREAYDFSPQVDLLDGVSRYLAWLGGDASESAGNIR